MSAKEIVRLIGGGRLMAVVSVKVVSKMLGRQEEVAECVWCSHGIPRRGKFSVKSLEIASTPMVRTKLPAGIRG